MNVLLILLLVLLTLWLFLPLRRFRKMTADLERSRARFVRYLKSIGDTDTLRAIGEINWFGQYERIRPLWWKMDSVLTEKMSADARFAEFSAAWFDWREFGVRFMILSFIKLCAVLLITAHLACGDRTAANVGVACCAVICFSFMFCLVYLGKKSVRDAERWSVYDA